MKDNYEDIIHLPHPVSRKHPQMSMENRAAQFAPFAALTGFHASIEEAARYTDNQVELDESRYLILNRKIHILIAHLSEKPQVSISYFVQDSNKEGGFYKVISGAVKNIDDYKHEIIMSNGLHIQLKDIIEIEGELFDNL